MKNNILDAFKLMQKYEVSRVKDMKFVQSIMSSIQEDGSITKQVIIDTLFKESKDQESAYRSFLSRLRNDIREATKEAHNNLIDKEILESFRITSSKETKTSPARVNFSAKKVSENTILPRANSNYSKESFVSQKAQKEGYQKNQEYQKSFFISYAINDKHLVNDFIAKLEERIKNDEGYKLWHMSKLVAGDRFDEQINAAMQQANFGLFLLSESFFKSSFIKEKELPHFLSQDILLPIGLESKIDGNIVSTNEFFKTIKEAHPEDNIQKLLDKQAYFLKDRNGDFYSGLDDQTKAQFIDELVEKIDALPTHTMAKKQIETSDRTENYNPDLYTKANAQITSFASKKSEETNPIAIDDLIQWAQTPHTENLYAILGDFGVGKTFTCRMLSASLAKMRETNLQLPRPIYIDLRDVPTFIETNNIKRPPYMREIIDFVVKDLEHIQTSDILEEISKGESLIIFDGLDEKIVHYTTDQSSQYLKELLSLMPQEQKTKVKIVLSCRTHYFENMRETSSFFTGRNRDGFKNEKYRAIELRPFSIEQIDEFLSKAISPKEISIIKDILQNNKYLGELASKPFMLNQMTQSIASLASIEGEINSAKFYETIVDDTFDRDKEKHILAPHIKKKIMQDLAYFMWIKNSQSFSIIELNDWFDDWLYDETNKSIHRKYQDKITNSLDNSLEVDLRNSTLLVRFGDEDFGFSHSSMQEYFISQYIYHQIQTDSGLRLPKKPSTLTIDFLKDSIALGDKSTLEQWASSVLGEDYDINSDIVFSIINNSQTLDSIQINELNLKNANLQDKKIQNLHAQKAVFSNTILTNSEWKNCILENIDTKNTCFNESIWLSSKWGNQENIQEKDDYFKYMVAYDSDIKTSVPVHSDMSQKITLTDMCLDFQLPHSSPITSIATTKDYIISGSGDRTIKIWNYDGKCIHTLSGHSDYVASIATTKDYIISGSDDKTIKIWNYDGKCVHTLEGHSDYINSIATTKDHIISGSYDKTIKVWNDNGECIMTTTSNKNDWLSYQTKDNQVTHIKASKLGYKLGNFVDKNKKPYFIDELAIFELDKT